MNTVKILGRCALALGCWLSGAAAGAEDAAGGGKRVVYILTNDGEVVSGAMAGFSDGLIVLLGEADGARHEISPQDVKAIFSKKQDCQAAQGDGEWLSKQLRVPEEPSGRRRGWSERAERNDAASEPRDEAQPDNLPRPPTDEAKPGEPTRKPEPGPAKEKEKDKPASAAGAEAEKEYLAFQPPPDLNRDEPYFGICIKSAQKVARAYGQEGSTALAEARKRVVETAQPYLGDPKAMLEPEKYRQVILGLALLRVELGMLEHRMQDEDADQKAEDEKTVKAIRAGSFLSGLMQSKTVQQSDLDQRQKYKALHRLHQLGMEMGFATGNVNGPSRCNSSGGAPQLLRGHANPDRAGEAKPGEPEDFKPLEDTGESGDE